MKQSLYASLLFFFLAIAPLFYPISAAEVTGKTITIVLDQTSMTAPQVLSVTIENNNPERYMVVYPDSFLTIKEVDAAGAVLYEGQISRTQFDPPNMDILVAINPLFIYFPYFDDATRVQIYDETNKQLLDIDLGQYSILPTPTAVPRSVECNACGYCTGKKEPGNLSACMACLYPNLSTAETLAANPPNYHPPKPRTGAYFSQLGCIDVGIAGFTDSSAAGGVLNAILNRFLFPVTGALALISLIYGAFLVMTAQADAEQIGRGKKWIYGAIIGILFTFGSILLIRIIAGDILKIPGFDF